jgi:hypothetical protein
MSTDPGKLAELFTKWAENDGIMDRITDEQAADLAHAFMAGYAQGLHRNAERMA